MAGAVAHNARETATLNDVRLMFRNFSGKQTQYNAAGKRNFVAFLPVDVAAAMAEDGWSIKTLASREEGEPAQDYIKVNVNFSGPRPPKIYMIKGGRRNLLTEDMMEILDWVDIEKTDLIITPYDWNIQGNTGRTAYLQTAFIFVREDELEARYSNIPDATVEGSQDVLLWQETTPEVLDAIRIKELES